MSRTNLAKKSVDRAVVETGNDENTNKTHLVVMVNGLWGRPSNWKYVVSQLEATLDMKQTVLLVSAANSGFQTYRGIDRCGDALVDEIKRTLPQYPELQRISFIGHSLGGLICRYAAGKLHNAEDGLIAGLRPAHFISMATPHLGCNGWGPNQVPFFRFLSVGPLKIGNFDRALQRFCRFFGILGLGRTGKQLFVLDRRRARDPLVMRLSRDIEGNGSFMAALSSFQTHTCYANTAIDKVVNWPNASLRDPSELPDIWDTPFGIVREDPLEAAFSQPVSAPEVESSEHQQHHGELLNQSGSLSRTQPQPSPVQQQQQQQQQQQPSTLEQPQALPVSQQKQQMQPSSQQQVPVTSQPHQDLHQQVPASSPAEPATPQQTDPPMYDQQGLLVAPKQQTATPPHSLADELQAAGQGKHGKKSGRLRRRWEKEMQRTPDADKQQWTAGLRRLQALPWRRIDVSFRGSSWSTFAHTHIQVTRPFLDSDGKPVVQHMARSLAEMESRCLAEVGCDA